MKALVPELRSLVSARSLPDDVVLRNMRRALSALGDEVSSSSLEDSVGPTASGGEEDVPGSSSTSVVTALAAVELKRETRLWMSMMYKNSSQHRRTIHFQRMRGVTRSLRALSELDVGSAAAAERLPSRRGVSGSSGSRAVEPRGGGWSARVVETPSPSVVGRLVTSPSRGREGCRGGR